MDQVSSMVLYTGDQGLSRYSGTHYTLYFYRAFPLNIEQVLRSPIHPSKVFASFQLNRSLPLNIEKKLRYSLHPFSFTDHSFKWEFDLY